jgi:hypothetical protein
MLLCCAALRFSRLRAPGTEALTQDCDGPKTAARVSDTKTASWIAALERARAELERALSSDGLPRGTDGDADRAGDERALGANPVYRCWEQLNEAIDELRSRAQAAQASAQRRVSLRDVLEQVRGDAGLLQGAEPQAGVARAGRRVVAWGAPSELDPPAAPSVEAGPAAPEAEEAMVSFVIREPARPPPAAGHGGDASGAKQLTVPPHTQEPEPDPGAEAEVVIIPRRR